MNNPQIECIACSGSFKSEKEYSKHVCKQISILPYIKEEPIEEDYNANDENIVVKLEPTDYLEIPDVDPLSFTSIKEEILPYENEALDIKTEDGVNSTKPDENNSEVSLSATSAKYVSVNTHLKCDACGKTFQNHKTFNQHVISSHKTFKPYCCNVCGKKFLQKHYVTLHMRVHTGERPYACPLCPKRYTHKTSFTIHMRIHRGERPYECGMCGKKCYDKSGLTSHIRSHTKETPYKCDVCDRRFTHSKSLLVHKRNHTGEKPYICRYCGKAFRHWHKHKIHVRLHTGERPYKCKVCGKGFPRNDEVKRHMRSHTGIKSFRCSICGANCATQSSITGHINLHHSNLTSDEAVPPEKTQVHDGMSGVLGSEGTETPSIYKNIAQQSSYVAKILMTARNKRTYSKRSFPPTKVIEITTKEPQSYIRIKPKIMNIEPLDSKAPKESKNSNQEFTYKEFLAWQKKMLDKQGLVVQGLPADDKATQQLSSLKVSSNQIMEELPSSRIIDELPSNLENGNQQFILLAQAGSNSTSKLLVPINKVGAKSMKSPIEIPSRRQIVQSAQNKPYLLVPESVASQSMFLLSSGPQKMLLLAPPNLGGSSLTYDRTPMQPSSVKVKIENVIPPMSADMNISDINMKIKLED